MSHSECRHLSKSKCTVQLDRMYSGPCDVWERSVDELRDGQKQPQIKQRTKQHRRQFLWWVLADCWFYEDKLPPPKKNKKAELSSCLWQCWEGKKPVLLQLTEAHRWRRLWKKGFNSHLIYGRRPNLKARAVINKWTECVWGSVCVWRHFPEN